MLCFLYESGCVGLNFDQLFVIVAITIIIYNLGMLEPIDGKHYRGGILVSLHGKLNATHAINLSFMSYESVR